MVTRYAVSPDGLRWTDLARCCAAVRPLGRAGDWVTAGAGHWPPATALYDGGPALPRTGRRRPVWPAGGRHPAAGRRRTDCTSPDSDGALRYVSVGPLLDGRTRFYFEAARADGSTTS